MSSSLMLTNSLFCGFAALLILPLLKHPDILNFKKGIPIWTIVILIIGKMLIPFEFPFTNTLASKNILPIIKVIENSQLLKSISIGNLLIHIWLSISVLLLIFLIFKHCKLIRLLTLIPETKNKELIQILSGLCEQKQIKNKPKVVQLDINTGPFIVGLRNPIIVLPLQLTENEANYIFLHELEHCKHHHNLIKACIEVVTTIYWWNPVVWLLHREIICALEIHADTNVMQELCLKSSLSYLETLINISKMNKNGSSNLVLPFALKNNMVEYRISTALKYKYSKENRKISLFNLIPLVLSICFFLISFTYTFESYDVSPGKIAGTFTIHPDTDYFILRQDKHYDLYINGEYVVTISSIPEDLKHLNIHK